MAKSAIDRLIAFFSRESTLRRVDKIVRNEFAIVFGFVLFVLALKYDLWNFIEPFLTLVVLPVGLATWYESWRARHARYAVDAVDREHAAIIAVEVNADTSASIFAHFNRTPDVLVRAVEEVGTAMLTPEDISRLAKVIFRKAAPYRNRTIFLVLAGPAGLCFQIGQLLAAHKFDVVPLSWARDHYQEIPRLGIDDIGQ